MLWRVNDLDTTSALIYQKRNQIIHCTKLYTNCTQFIVFWKAIPVCIHYALTNTKCVLAPEYPLGTRYAVLELQVQRFLLICMLCAVLRLRLACLIFPWCGLSIYATRFGYFCCWLGSSFFVGSYSYVHFQW
jgi:hypothetical protein